MYVDSKLLFADSQTLAGSAVSENVVDLKDPRKVGIGENMFIVVVVKADLTGTLQVNLEHDDAEGFPSAVIRDIGTFAAAATAGSKLVYRINSADMAEQFVRLDFNGATAGDVSAFITHDIDDQETYASGFTVS